MRLSKIDRGSAVVEFVMLGAPALLIFVTGLTLIANSYLDTLVRAVALDTSRYLALADQNNFSAQTYLDDKLAQTLPGVKIDSLVTRTNFAMVELSYRPFSNLFNLVGSAVRVRVVTPVENFG